MSSPSAPSTPPAAVAVIGGGITGLAAALRLQQSLPQRPVHLFEASAALGGVLQTSSQEGYLVEHAADNFLADSRTSAFFRQQGLEEELIPTDPRYRRALVVRGGRLHPIPEGFRLMLPGAWGPLLRSPLLTWPGKLRLMAEPLVPAYRSSGEESLEQFAVRRLGREAFQWIVQPLVGGIYTADPCQLSLDAALPQFRRWERRYGSLTRAAWGQHRQRPGPGAGETDSGARYSQFLGPRLGMADLVARLAQQARGLQVHLGSRVERLDYRGRQWHLDMAGGERLQPFAALVVAVSAPHAARLLRPLSAPAAEILQQIPCASSAVVALGYPAGQIGRSLDAFGIVVPAAEGRRILAVSMASLKFAGRAPEGYQLLRVFLGGALQPEVLELADDELIATAIGEVAELLRIEGPPVYRRLVRWPQAMPQYNLGHAQRIGALQSALARFPRLHLAGNYFSGVGIPHCLQSGLEAAERLVADLDDLGVAADHAPADGGGRETPPA